MDNNEIFKRGEFSGTLRKKAAPNVNNNNNNNNNNNDEVVARRPLTLSSSTKKNSGSGTSSFNSLSTSTASASKLKKKKSISLSREDKIDKDEDNIVSSSSSLRIPKSKDEIKDRQKITKITRPSTQGDDRIRSSTITSITSSSSTSSNPSVKDQIQEVKIKKKRSKSVGSFIKEDNEGNESTMDKLKSSVSNVHKQKSLKRKSIDSGNIFQLDAQIEQAKKEEDQNDHQDIEDNDIEIELEESHKSKKIKSNSTKKKNRHSIAGDSVSSKKKDTEMEDIFAQPKKSIDREIEKKKKKRSSTLSVISNNSNEFINRQLQQQQQQQQQQQPVITHNVQFNQPPTPIQQSSYVNNNNNHNSTVYPKTPIPNKSGNKKSIGSSTPFVRMTPMSVQSSNQHFYPQSPGGFDYNNNSPLPMQSLDNNNNNNNKNNNNNYSMLSPSEKDISFDNDSQYDEQLITNDVYNDNRNYSQYQSTPRIISDEQDEFILFKYLLLIGSFIFWFITLYTLFGFFYHFNDIKYCDTNVTPRYDGDGKLDCQWCPDKGICEGGKFIGCQSDYVVRYNKRSGSNNSGDDIECILDPSKVQTLITSLNNIDNVLRDHKGKFECGTSNLISLDTSDQLKKQVLARYWLNKDHAEQSYNTLVDYITNGKNIEELGIDRKLIKTLGVVPMEDGTFHLYSNDEPNRPLWCQSYFFIKSIIMNYIHFLIIAVLGYLGFKYYKYQKHNQNEEILMVEQTFRKVTRSLQQRKQTYEESWVSELILREEILGPRSQEDKKLARIWEKTMELIYKNHRILVTPKEVLGESVSTLEWIDSGPTPKKSQPNNNNSNDSINYDDISIDNNEN